MAIRNLQKVVPEPILASAWVEPESAVGDRMKMGMRAGVRGAAEAAGAVDAAAADTTDLPQYAALAAVADGLWIVPMRTGMVSGFVPMEGGVKIHRSQFTAITIGAKGVLRLPVHIVTTTPYGTIEYFVHKTRRKPLDDVIRTLGF